MVVLCIVMNFLTVSARRSECQENGTPDVRKEGQPCSEMSCKRATFGLVRLAERLLLRLSRHIVICHVLAHLSWLGQSPCHEEWRDYAQRTQNAEVTRGTVGRRRLGRPGEGCPRGDGGSSGGGNSDGGRAASASSGRQRAFFAKRRGILVLRWAGRPRRGSTCA